MQISLFMDTGYKLPPLMSKADTNKYDSFQPYLKSAIALCPAGWRNLIPCQSLLNLAKEHRPEQARTHIGVVADVVTAVVRTVVRTIGSRTVRVVEHPKRSRRRQRHETTVATDLSLQPIPRQGESGYFSIFQYLPIFLYLISFFQY